MKILAVLAALSLALTPGLAAAADPVPATPADIAAAQVGQTTGGVANDEDDDELGFIIPPEGVVIGGLVLLGVGVIAIIASQNGRNTAATNTN